MAATAQAFILLFDTNFGVTNHVLGLVGLPEIGWLTSTFWSKPTIALFVLWKTSGFALIIMLAAVQQIPGEVYEAAAIDGARRVRTFFSITVPLVRRSVAFFPPDGPHHAAGPGTVAGRRGRQPDREVDAVRRGPSPVGRGDP